jgi:hypothetical protein
MSKNKTTTTTKSESPKRKIGFKNVFNGVAMLFVIASISAMSVIIWLGTDGIISRVLTVPAILFAAVQAVVRFTK